MPKDQLTLFEDPYDTPRNPCRLELTEDDAARVAEARGLSHNSPSSTNRFLARPWESEPAGPTRCATCGAMLTVTPCRACRLRDAMKARRRRGAAAELPDLHHMTAGERAASLALAACRMLPGTFEKRFARSMETLATAAADSALLTEKQSKLLWDLVYRFRRQITDPRLVDLAQKMGCKKPRNKAK